MKVKNGNNITLDPIVKGNYFKDLPFRISENGLSVDLSEAVIKIDFKSGSKVGKLRKQTFLGQGLTLLGETGEFQLDGFTLDWPVGKYFFDCLIVKDDKPFTYFEGTLLVLQNVTEQ